MRAAEKTSPPATLRGKLPACVVEDNELNMEIARIYPEKHTGAEVVPVI